MPMMCDHRTLTSERFGGWFGGFGVTPRNAASLAAVTREPSGIRRLVPSVAPTVAVELIRTDLLFPPMMGTRIRVIVLACELP
jgi:hypothetical protein